MNQAYIYIPAATVLYRTADLGSHAELPTPTSAQLRLLRITPLRQSRNSNQPHSFTYSPTYADIVPPADSHNHNRSTSEASSTHARTAVSTPFLTAPKDPGRAALSPPAVAGCCPCASVQVTEGYSRLAQAASAQASSRDTASSSSCERTGPGWNRRRPPPRPLGDDDQPWESMVVLGASWGVVKASPRHTTRKLVLRLVLAWTVPRNELTSTLSRHSFSMPRASIDSSRPRRDEAS